MSKRLLLLLAFFSIPFYNVNLEGAFYAGQTFFSQEPLFFLHTIERGQTVYSISVMYGVPVEEIYLMNPESRTGIRAGDVLKILQLSGSYLYHTIRPGETLYGLAQKYEMKGEDIVKANPGLSVTTFSIGKIIRIPTNMVTTPIQGGNETLNRLETNSLLSQVHSTKSVKTINLALLLPFALKDTAQNALQKRMVEYTEGFLLAIEKLKKSGVPIHLQLYDIGSNTRDIQSIFKEDKMQDIHLLIGGQSDEQIKLLSRFAKEKNIPYIIPLSSQSDEPFNNPHIYQVNTPQSYLYSKAASAFINKFGKDNIIIVTSETGASKRGEFIDLLKQDLQDRKIAFKTVASGANIFNNIKALMSKTQKNVIVPSDASAETLSKLTPALKSMIETQPDISLSLFGYPDWQTYSEKFSDDFFRLNTTFFAHFYSNPTSPDVKAFYTNFYRWYSRLLGDTYPKYGMLGYDTGMFFISLIHTYGSEFSARVNDLRYTGIQTDFRFERLNNWSGFINTNMYLITYNSDYTITKSIVK